MPAKYDAAYENHLLRSREHKRQKSDQKATALGMRYCASRMHYKPLAEVTRRRGGKVGPWICDECYEKRAEHLKTMKQQG